MSALGVELVDPHASRAEATWRRLEQAAAPSYFLTWTWIQHWLTHLPPAEAPDLAVLSLGRDVLGACFLTRRRVVRHGVVVSNALFMNTTGSASDELCIEHNAVLRAPAATFSLADFVEALEGDWDELDLPALGLDAFPGRALGESLPHHALIVDRETTAPFVDLARVRTEAGGYPALLGHSTRAQIRRAQRKFGEITVEHAKESTHALDIYDELAELHGRHWREVGKPGAFADPWFDRFHRDLVAERAPHGDVQLLRLRAGGRTFACLYNFVANGRVLFYQSGVARFDDPHLKPGYVAHAEAVRLNAQAGMRVYDLLGGDAYYKSRLATGEARLVWARIQRPLARFRAENQLRAWKRAIGDVVAALRARPAAEHGASPAA